jgi:hypothetical protein
MAAELEQLRSEEEYEDGWRQIWSQRARVKIIGNCSSGEDEKSGSGETPLVGWC